MCCKWIQILEVYFHVGFHVRFGVHGTKKEHINSQHVFFRVLLHLIQILKSTPRINSGLVCGRAHKKHKCLVWVAVI